MEALPDFQTDTLTYPELAAATRAFVTLHPGNMLAEQRLIFILSNGWWSESERDKEISRYRAMKDRRIGEFLEAALRLAYSDPRQLTLRFPELARQMCLSPIFPLARLRNPDQRADALPDALGVLGSRTDNGAVILWWEVIDAMDHLHDPRLPDAVATLRAMNRYGNEQWVNYTLRALAVLKDDDGARRLREEVAARRPDSRYAMDAAFAAWKAGHFPSAANERGLMQFGREGVLFLRRLSEDHPRSIAAAGEYLSAASYGNQPGLSAKEALDAVDTALQYDRDYPFAFPFRIDDTPLQAARVYLDRNVRLDEVPRLVSEQLRRRRVEYEQAPTSSSTLNFSNDRLRDAELRANNLLAEYWFHKKNPTETARYAELARTELAGFMPAANAADGERKSFEAKQSQWMRTMKTIGMETKPLTEPRTIDWSRVPRVAFPEFSVTDLDGRHWDLAAWKGKAVFVNLWGTWCIPCRAEMPNIQKLHDDANSSGGRLVITVNVDDDVELTRKFMLESGYTFPVIRSAEFAALIDHSNGFPQSRVIDAQGRMLNEQVDIHCATCVDSLRRLMDVLAAK